MIDGLNKQGHTCVVISSWRGSLNKKLDVRGVDNYVYPFKPWVYKSEEWIILKKIRNKLFQSISVARTNNKIAKQCAYVIEKHNIDLVYSNSSISNIGHIVSKKYELPHIWHLREFGDKDFGFKWSYGKRFTQKVINSADHIIAVSQAVKKHHCIREKNVSVIYDGVVPKSHFQNRKLLEGLEKKDRSTFVFALIGSIGKAKGQQEALLAFNDIARQYENVYLYFIGKGDQSNLKKKTKRLDIEERIKFFGHVDNVYDLYNQIDCVLVCSRNEGFGMVTVEAMAGRKPVIARNSGGPGEIIEDEKTGLLYDGSIEGLSRSMEKIMLDERLRNNLVESVFLEAKNYTYEKFTQDINKILNINCRKDK